MIYKRLSRKQKLILYYSEPLLYPNVFAAVQCTNSLSCYKLLLKFISLSVRRQKKCSLFPYNLFLKQSSSKLLKFRCHLVERYCKILAGNFNKTTEDIRTLFLYNFHSTLFYYDLRIFTTIFISVTHLVDFLILLSLQHRQAS